MELFESDDETIQEFAHKISEIFDMTCETMQTDDKHTLINIKWKVPLSLSNNTQTIIIALLLIAITIQTDKSSSAEKMHLRL